MAELTGWTWAATGVAVVAVTVYSILKNLNWWLYVPRLPDGRRVPPGELGWPVFGKLFNFLKAFKSQNADSFIHHYITRYGRIGLYTTHLFGQPTVLATTPGTNKAVLMDSKLFETGWPISTRRLLGMRSFAAIVGAEHRRLRRLTQSHLQGQSSLKFCIPRVEKLVKQKLEALAASEGEIELIPHLRELTFEIILDNLTSNEFGPKTRSLLENFDRMVNGLRCMPINLPGTAYNKALKSRADVIGYVQSLIDDRRASKISHRRDVLQSLLDLVDENGVHLADEEIRDTLVSFLIAGHASSTFSIAWVMILLERHPSTWKKTREEQQRIQKMKQPGENLTYADFRNMTYLNDVIDETLRIVNVAPFVFRKVQETNRLAGYTLPKGWTVQAWSRAVHLDPEIYPDPYAFKPERWQTFQPKQGQYIPFGLGARSCIGNELAKLEMSIFLHHAILSYTWEPRSRNSPVKYLPHPEPKDHYLVRFSSLDSKTV